MSERDDEGYPRVIDNGDGSATVIARSPEEQAARLAYCGDCWKADAELRALQRKHDPGPPVYGDET